MVFGGKKNNLIDFEFSIWGFARQLSITGATRLPSDEQFWYSSRTQPSNFHPIHPAFFDVDIGKVNTLRS